MTQEDEGYREIVRCRSCAEAVAKGSISVEAAEAIEVCEPCADALMNEFLPITYSYIFKYCALLLAYADMQTYGETVGRVWTEVHPVRGRPQGKKLGQIEGYITLRLFRGYRKALAKWLRVSPSRVSRWLAGEELIPERHFKKLIMLLPLGVIVDILETQEYFARKGLLHILSTLDPVLHWNGELVGNRLYDRRRHSTDALSFLTFERMMSKKD